MVLNIVGRAVYILISALNNVNNNNNNNNAELCKKCSPKQATDISQCRAL